MTGPELGRRGGASRPGAGNPHSYAKSERRYGSVPPRILRAIVNLSIEVQAFEIHTQPDNNA